MADPKEILLHDFENGEPVFVSGIPPYTESEPVRYVLGDHYDRAVEALKETRKWLRVNTNHTPEQRDAIRAAHNKAAAVIISEEEAIKRHHSQCEGGDDGV